MEGEKTVVSVVSNDDLARKRTRASCIVLAVVSFLVVVPVVVLGAYLASKNRGKSNDDANRSAVENADTTESTDEAVSDNKSAPKATSTADNSAVEAAEKEKLLNFFVELANKDDKDKSLAEPIARWNKPNVSVGVGEGTFSERQSSCLNGHISDFNSVSSSMKLFRDDTVDLGIPNIKIFYQDPVSFSERSGTDQRYGYQEGAYNDDMSFKRAAIFLSEAIASLDGVVECQVIRHEMTHAIGFWGHSDIYFESIMSLPKTSYTFNTADRKAIEMLYNSGVPLGAKEAEVRAYFAGREY
jgi:hypothetical protein